MKSVIGSQIQLCLFGESHGEGVGVVVNGFPSGIRVDEQFISNQMDLRKPKGTISTQRKETDNVRILSGVFNQKTCGTPLCMFIENTSQHTKDYEKTKHFMRPSHADYTANVKYHGYQDYRGGGHFSGRLTAPLVAAGAIFIDMLKSKGIHIGSHIAQIKDVKDDIFSFQIDKCLEQINLCNGEYFATLNENSKNKMLEVIEEARINQDSVGGILQTAIVGLPSGVGEPFFHSIESNLSQLIFSVGGVKGIEFGLGFDFAYKNGSSCNDEFFLNEGEVKTKTNNNAGINGGISNGMPITLNTVIKPTPSIYRTQNTVDIKMMKNTTLSIEGRHDPCIVHRARVVIDSVIAFGLVDLLIERYGIQYFMESLHD